MTRRGIFLDAAAIDVFNNGEKSTVEKKARVFTKNSRILRLMMIT